jgi:hypothetical protein
MKLPFQKIKDEFLTFGYELLIEEKDYQGASKKYLCLCPQKIHKLELTISYLRMVHRKKRGDGCEECKHEGNFKQVLEELKDVGYTTDITAKEYVNRSTRFPGKCVRKHDVQISMEKIKQRGGCCLECRPFRTIETNMRERGVSNVFQDPVVKAKIIETNMRERGVPYSCQDPAVIAKIREVNMEKRGVGCVFQDPAIKEQIKEIHMKNRGVPYASQDPIVKQKIVDTNMERRGVSYPMQDPSVRAKYVATSMERRGVPHPTQDPTIKRTEYRSKTYTYPSGNTTSYQGYEGMCLDDLIKTEGYSEDEILNLRSDMPKIWYEYNDTDHRYFPDIFLPKEKRFIEVKSKYYFDQDKEVNLLKQKACVDLGYKHEIRIYDRKGNFYVYK